MNFYFDQIFEGKYPPEAAQWCQANSALIEEIKPLNGVRRFQVKEIPAPTPEELEAQALAEAKAERAEAVSKIVVEVDGMRFDGDEESQGRLSRTISAAVALGVDLDTYTQAWVLADNTIAQPTIKQLATALKLAGEAQTALWTVPYEEAKA